MRHCPWAVLFACVFASTSVQAQDSATLNRFSASATPADDFQIDRPIAPGHLVFGAMVHVDHGLDPLVFRGAEGDGPEQEVRVVSHQVMANAALSLGLGDRFVVFAGLPVTWMAGDDDPMIGSTPLAPHDDLGLGDAYLGGRALLFGGENDLLAAAVQVTGTAPTAGKNQRFRGDEFLSVIPEALLAIRPGAGARITLNLGARVRRGAEDADTNLEFGTEFTYAMGFAIPVWQAQAGDHLDLHAQGFGTTNFVNAEGSPLEAVFGAKYFHSGGFVLGAAAGPGVTRGFGSPAFRSILTIGYQMPAERDRDGDGILDDVDGCPMEPEDRDDFEDGDGCPDMDNDGDGLLDPSDQCPLKPETRNDLDDEDGCPDAWGDSDGDGLLDNADACPKQPEDADGFEDEDGCPDPDNDGDGVLDVDDACPMEPGVPAEKGCPIRDRDGDTVPDAEDNCPDEPGPVENQGCKKQQKVKIEATGLQILEKVFFKTNKAVIQRRSYDLLDNVAEVLGAHPDIAHIIVEGHTDARGRRARNMKLSQERAEAVVAYLIKQGVEADRLEARGFGPDRPIVPGAQTRADHARNRRVEFRIPTPGTGVDGEPQP